MMLFLIIRRSMSAVWISVNGTNGPHAPLPSTSLYPFRSIYGQATRRIKLAPMNITMIILLGLLFAFGLAWHDQPGEN
jgi:hypothetical protein